MIGNKRMNRKYPVSVTRENRSSTRTSRRLAAGALLCCAMAWINPVLAVSDDIVTIPADALRIVQPAGRVIIPADAPAAWLPVAVEIVFPADLPAPPTVRFVLDGALCAAVEQFDLYTTAAWFAPGDHEIQVTVEISLPQAEEDAGGDVPWTWTSDPARFVVLSAADADQNGLPDEGPGMLTDPGDLWLAADVPDGQPRWTALVALRADASDTDILLPLPGAAGGLARLNLPEILAVDGVARVAGLALGRNEAALAVAYEGVESERPGDPVPPGVFARVSLFEADAGGWREIGDTIPGGAPPKLFLAGLRPAAGHLAYPAIRPVGYYRESPYGQLNPALTDIGWQREPAILADTPMDGTSPVTLRLTRTGLAGVFQRGLPANLRVEPGGESGYLHLGILPTGKTWTQVFTLTNTGSTPIMGQCLLTGDNAFRLIEPATYTVLPGQAATITLVFLPADAGDYGADLVFSGGEKGLLALRVEARATGVPVKARQLFACGNPGAGDSGAPSSGGDAAAVILALGVLLAGRRTMNRPGQRESGRRAW